MRFLSAATTLSVICEGRMRTRTLLRRRCWHSRIAGHGVAEQVGYGGEVGVFVAG
jgi:hypothetical protein